jgi:hypothetical protein
MNAFRSCNTWTPHNTHGGRLLALEAGMRDASPTQRCPEMRDRLQTARAEPWLDPHQPTPPACRSVYTTAAPFAVPGCRPCSASASESEAGHMGAAATGVRLEDGGAGRSSALQHTQQQRQQHLCRGHTSINGCALDQLIKLTHTHTTRGGRPPHAHTSAGAQAAPSTRGWHKRSFCWLR